MQDRQRLAISSDASSRVGITLGADHDGVAVAGMPLRPAMRAIDQMASGVASGVHHRHQDVADGQRPRLVAQSRSSLTASETVAAGVS